MSEKCSPDDPRRCMGVTPHGQCEYLAVEGSEKCNYHTRGRNTKNLHKKRVERYLIDNAQLRESYERQNNDANYLDLRDEITLVQAVIERRMGAIKTDADLTMAIGHFTQLVQRVESMKISLMKLQQQLGMVLGKDELRQLASTLAQLLDEELEGLDNKEELMDRLLERLCTAIENAGRKDTDD